MTWDQVFSRWRESEDMEMVLAFLSDQDARLMSAWKRIGVRFRPEHPPESDDPWEQAWLGSEYDATELAELTSIPPAAIPRIVARLAGVRAIYPDGTLAEPAQLYVAEVVRAKIKKASGG